MAEEFSKRKKCSYFLRSILSLTGLRSVSDEIDLKKSRQQQEMPQDRNRQRAKKKRRKQKDRTKK